MRPVLKELQELQDFRYVTNIKCAEKVCEVECEVKCEE